MSLKSARKIIKRAVGRKRRSVNLSSEALLTHELEQLIVDLKNVSELKELFLHNNRLVELPASFVELRSIEMLNLQNNQLKKLPEWLGELKCMKILKLHDNRLASLPKSFGLMSSLIDLDLGDNRLCDLPASFGQLRSLRDVKIDGNALTELPSSFGNLNRLNSLWLQNNRLKELPSSLAKLTKLRDLNLSDNRLSKLPETFGELRGLVHLRLSENRLKSPPPEVVDQGIKGILQYLRSRASESSKQWISKMLVVGEGGVGKTQLIRSILGEEFEVESDTTFGIEIRPVEFPHPTESDVDITLKAWDFGGQTIYHATHQFFLSNRSLFVVVWNRRGQTVLLVGYDQIIGTRLDQRVPKYRWRMEC